MSDYIPNPGPGMPGGLPGGPYDPNNRFNDPRDPGGNGPYVLLAILVAVAVIGGVVYFSHGNRDRGNQQASAPVTTPMPANNGRPAEPLLPGSTPATPAQSNGGMGDSGTGPVPGAPGTTK